MEQKGSERVKRTQRDYSLAFKLQVIDEVEKGYCTYKEVRRNTRFKGDQASVGVLHQYRTSQK